jgi:hypothetical protein
VGGNRPQWVPDLSGLDIHLIGEHTVNGGARCVC